MARRRDIPWGLWLGCLAAALLAHAALVVPGGRALARSLRGGFEPRTDSERLLPFEIVEPDSVDSLRLLEVDVGNDRRPSDSTRVAERDSDVEHETQAPPGRRPSAPASASKRSSKRSAPTSEPPIEPADSSELVEADDGREPGAQTPPTEPTPSTDWAKLGGSVGMLRDAFGTAGQPTQLPSVEPAQETMLDSRAHLYAQFFTRVRERIVASWDVERAIERNDPQRVELGGVERTTVVRVELDRRGAIASLAFEGESGVEYLDVEAIRALRAAAPFPNPPDGLFGAKAKVEIKVAFVVTADGSARVMQHEN